MNDAKHTPGPWTAEDMSGEYFPHVRVGADRPFCDGSGTGEHLMTVNVGQPDSKHWSNTMETCQANARLIAAAPDLLEACKSVEEAWAGNGNMASAVDTVLLAISKAEGEL